MATIKAIKFTHKTNAFYIGLLNAKTLTDIAYVARRGVDQEEGAVQRILNKQRISGIRDFVLNGGFFPNNIILNVKEDANLIFNETNQEITFIDNIRIAQIIDGQHRVEGLKEAIKNEPSIGERLIPVVFANNLKTEDCAEIFININTEQKTVPKSLIYDLYGLMNTSANDFSIERGKDIAEILNKDDNSPYQGYIKFPGARKFKGGIQLSTVINNLKNLVKSEGEFEKYSLKTLDFQVSVLKNYFNAIQNCYGQDWDSVKNPFIFASGFGAAIDVFISSILPYSYSNKNFKENFYKGIILIPSDKLIKQDQVKGMSGEAARNFIKQELSNFIVMNKTTEDDFEI